MQLNFKETALRLSSHAIRKDSLDESTQNEHADTGSRVSDLEAHGIVPLHSMAVLMCAEATTPKRPRGCGTPRVDRFTLWLETGRGTLTGIVGYLTDIRFHNNDIRFRHIVAPFGLFSFHLLDPSLRSHNQ